MKRALNWLRNALTPAVLTFVAGVITTVLTRAFFERVISLSDALLDLFTIILVIFAVATIANLRQEISSRLKPTISATNYHAKKTIGGDASLYDPLADFISSAKESILVVSRFMPPSLAATPARTNYYQTLNTLLREKHKKGETFRYERILQVKQVTREQILSSQLDNVLFEHCKQLIEMKTVERPLTIRLWQIPDILGSISFVIVDDERIFFLIPTLDHGKRNELIASHLGTGLSFIDPDRVLVREMYTLFDDLREQANRVVECNEVDQQNA